MFCLPPPVVSGVEVITIGEGVIAYQYEEGSVPEGRVEATCGVDGSWCPDPTQHMCSGIETTTISRTTTATTTKTATTATSATIATATTTQQGMYRQ